MTENRDVIHSRLIKLYEEALNGPFDLGVTNIEETIPLQDAFNLVENQLQELKKNPSIALLLSLMSYEISSQTREIVKLHIDAFATAIAEELANK